MLASLGFPTPDDNYPLLLMAAIVIAFRCRDKARQLTTTGRVWLVLVLIAWMLTD